MPVAALYDIHGNVTALEAVLAEVDALGCDRIVIGGDVALGPAPKQTLDLLARRGDQVQFLRGNCDREMATVLARELDLSKPWERRLRWAAENVSSEQLAMLGQLPLTLDLAIEGLGDVLFCHGSPRSDEEIVTRNSPDSRLAGMLAGVRQGIVISGHTHVQFDRIAHGRRWINAGSVGMPYEGRPGAYWALLGPSVELRRTAYDLERAAEAIRASGYPDADDFARNYVLSSMAPAEASERFEKMAVERGRSGG